MRKIILLFAIFMAADGTIELSQYKETDTFQTIKNMFIMFDEMIGPIKIEGPVTSEETQKGETSLGEEEERQEEGNEDQIKGKKHDTGSSSGESKIRMSNIRKKQARRQRLLGRKVSGFINGINERLDKGDLNAVQLATLLYYKYLFLSYSMMIINGLYQNNNNRPYTFVEKRNCASVALYFLEASVNFPLEKAISALKGTLRNEDGYNVESRMNELKTMFIDLQNSIYNDPQKEFLLRMERKSEITSVPMRAFNEEAYTYLKKFFATLLFRDRVFYPPPETYETIQDHIVINMEKIFKTPDDDDPRTELSAKVQAVEKQIREALGITTDKKFDQVPNKKLGLEGQRTVEVFEYYDEKKNEITPQLYIMEWKNVDHNENDD